MADGRLPFVAPDYGWYWLCGQWVRLGAGTVVDVDTVPLVDPQRRVSAQLAKR